MLFIRAPCLSKSRSKAARSPPRLDSSSSSSAFGGASGPGPGTATSSGGRKTRAKFSKAPSPPPLESHLDGVRRRGGAGRLGKIRKRAPNREPFCFQDFTRPSPSDRLSLVLLVEPFLQRREVVPDRRGVDPVGSCHGRERLGP